MATESFEAILEEHGKALARIAAGYARSGPDLDDLTQEIALAVWRALPGFRGDSALRTFLFRIAHNRGLHYVWRLRLRSLEQPCADLPEPADLAPGPAEAVAGRHEEEALLRGVRRLPLGIRHVVMLALDGLSHREIAQVLGIEENNVAVRLHRGRRALRGWLEESNGS